MATDKDHPKKDKAPPASKDAGRKKPGATKPDAHADAAPEPAGPRETPRLKKQYDEVVSPKLASAFGLANPNQRPRLRSIVLNVNMGRHLENNKLPPNVKQTVVDTITRVTGQKPVITKAKKSVSNFKVREGAETAAMVTLRRDRMWHFLDRFINLATPRIKDFRGLNPASFDKGGNYAVGLTEQGVFPEINMADVNFTHGMNINMIFSGSRPEWSRFILSELGMPFKKPEESGAKKK
ncbi:MAG: 50S ribosomal protein L5 [Phycisphaerae bacterium]|nr:50S ribosomal protein L5 [Phycisphaerae bacterium]